MGNLCMSSVLRVQIQLQLQHEQGETVGKFEHSFVADLSFYNWFIYNC